MGRKPITTRLARNRRVAIMMTESEYEAAEAAMEGLGYPTMSDMVRDALKVMIEGRDTGR